MGGSRRRKRSSTSSAPSGKRQSKSTVGFPYHGMTMKPPQGDRLVRTLDRVISKSGVGSRTEARGWIREGKAAVNGVVVRDPDHWLDVWRDRVTLDGRPLANPKLVYLVLYKPKGYLTTYDDPE